jgi:hypothetical protein
VTETNKRVAAQVNPVWDESNKLTVEELKRYFSIDMYMDLVQRRGDIKNYWNLGKRGDPVVKKIMSRDRFLNIRNNLTHLDTSDVSPENRAQNNARDGFWTVDNLFDELHKKFQNYFKPYKKISIDEICVFYKGRHRCRCYNPMKPNKWHFKIYALCDVETGYVYSWHLYRGKDEQRPRGMSATFWPTFKLTDYPELWDDGYILGEDNWFSGLDVFDLICGERRFMDYISTLRVNRKGLPRDGLFSRTGENARPRGTIKVMQTTIADKDCYMTSWMDNKPVHMLSSIEPKGTSCFRLIKNNRGVWERTVIPCPTTIPIYNHNMGGVDKNDQFSAYYDMRFRCQGRWQPRLERKARKISLINAKILYNEAHPNQPKKTLLDYMWAVFDQWSSIYESESESSSESDSEVDEEVRLHLQKRRRHTYTLQQNYEERTSGDHQIAIKRSMVNKRGHYKNIRCNCRICGAKINSFCEKCNIPLCQKIYGEDKNCFKEFHESRTLGATKRKYSYY